MVIGPKVRLCSCSGAEDLAGVSIGGARLVLVGGTPILLGVARGLDEVAAESGRRVWSGSAEGPWVRGFFEHREERVDRSCHGVRERAREAVRG